MKAGNRDSSQPPTTAEEEALKRNTDCVYFLASPLTCKKGSECEYRHSEEARINPRDCWFWLNKNCLNAKCSFRHPPLDGLLGTTAATPVRTTVPPTQSAMSTQFSAPHVPSHNSSKQATPCFYFQKGLCLKGDRCPFMHGPQPIDNPLPQPPAPKVSTSVTESQTHKKPLWGIEKCAQPKKILQANIVNPVEAPFPVKPPTKSEALQSKNGIAVERTMPQHISSHNEPPVYKPTTVPPFMSGNSVSRTHRSRNGKEPDEFLGESSPGFDVLVDDDLLDTDYYRDEDEFGRMTVGHEGRHLNAVNEFDYGRSADYNSLAKFDREAYNDHPHGYDPYGGVQDQYAWEQHRASSERIPDRPSVPERRGLLRPESPDQIDESDLRYRLSKQRRIDGSRLALSPDRCGEFYRRDDRGRHVEDKRYQGHSRRDSHHLVPHESSISNRLRGRISHLGRSSPDGDHKDSHLERKMDSGRNRGRSSPGRLITSSHQGRFHERIQGRPQEDHTAEKRNFRGLSMRRDDVDNNTSDFAGPKSLAELKGTKVSESFKDQPTKGEQVPHFGERKNPKIGKVMGHQESMGSLSFEGPKPLSMILKRKREEKTADSGDSIVSGNGEEINEKERSENTTTGVEEKRSFKPSEFKEDVEEEDEDGLIHTKGDKDIHEDQSFAQRVTEHEETEDVTMIDKVEDQELETFDQRDGEFDYEAVDGGGDFKTGEDENADQGEEYYDDEDGDDFAKRIGVMFS